MAFEPNFALIPLVAFIPLIIAVVWYHPNVFGRTLENQTKTKMPPFGVFRAVGSYILGFLTAFGLMGYVNHQMSLLQLFIGREGFGQEGTEATLAFEQAAKLVGDMHLSFGHGVVHGVLGAVVFILPVIIVLAVRERHNVKYILIHFGYWLLSWVLMSGVLCEWGMKVNL
ncbi:MAG: DUF1761 domain-containing protein [Aureispira sp.]